MISIYTIISKGKKETNRSQKMMVLFFLLSSAARCQFWGLIFVQTA